MAPGLQASFLAMRLGDAVLERLTASLDEYHRMARAHCRRIRLSP